MLHLCDVNDLYSPSGGGVRTFHERKLRHFAERADVRYSLVVPGERDGVEERGATRVVSVRSPRVPGLRHYRVLVSPRRLARALDRLEPDVVEVGGCYLTPWLVALALRGRRVVRTGFWHTDYPHAFVERPLARWSPGLARLAKGAAWGYARLTYGRLAHVFVASDYAERCLAEQGIGPLSHLPLGVDVERFRPERRDADLRRSVGASDEVPLCVFPHRLIEEKGLATLLRAWPAVRARTRAVLAFLGTGPRLGRLRRWLAGRDDARHLGYVADADLVARWIASADVVFALSPYETFGLTAAEAMACGVPLVAADGGAVADHVRAAGCGALVPPGDAAGLAAATVELLEAGAAARAELGARGREFAVERFSWGASFDGMLERACELAARRPAS